MSKVLDFDLFMSERSHETIDVVVFGKTYKVKREAPAIVPVLMARAEETEDTSMVNRAIIRAADGWFGSDTVDEFCRNGMTTNELAALINRLFKEVQGTAEDDEAEEMTDEDSRVAVQRNKAKK